MVLRTLLMVVVVVSTSLRRIRAALPRPLDTVCTMDQPLGCYTDSFRRTFPVAVSDQPDMPFASNMTLETCAYLCHKSSQPGGPFSAAAVETGSQCFCVSAADLATAEPNRTSMRDCTTLPTTDETAPGGFAVPCVGNEFQMCGGAWRLLAYNFTCSVYSADNQPWLDHTLSDNKRVADLVARLSPPQLVAQLYMNGADIYSPHVQLPRYIPTQECLAGMDGGNIFLAPKVNTTPSSAFPQPVNMGNTFDVELTREVAAAISDEARAAFNHVGRPSLTCMSPNLNVNRDPRWGRNIESFSEDPALIEALGVSYIHGIQQGRADAVDTKSATSGYLKIMAVPKHLGAYSVECFNPTGGPNEYPHCPVYRSNFNAVVDEIDLRETYFPGWRAAVDPDKGSAQGVMCSYNAINGVPDCLNGQLLRDTLYQEWSLKGFVISDAGAVGHASDIATQPPGQGFAHGLRAAAVAALVNGTVISIESGAGSGRGSSEAAFQTQLLPALEAGQITLQQLQAAATRALLPRFRVGLYDPPELVPWNRIPASVIESPAHHSLARRAAAESFVLLKNDNKLLPLKTATAGGPKTIAVVGFGANSTSSSINRYSGHPQTSTSVWDGMSAAAVAGGGKAVLGGGDSSALALVKTADVAVVVVSGEAEGESHDRQQLGLPPDQLAFLSSLIETKVPLVVCIISGGAVDVTLAKQHAQAVIAMYSGGMEAGAALADVVFGAVNPSGVLAAGIYRANWSNASDFLSMSMRKPPGRTHRYLDGEAVAAHILYPFGFGGSYSNWSATIAPIRADVSVAELDTGHNVTITVTIHNVDGPAGSRVSYVMLRRIEADPTEAWPRQWLPVHGFAKVHGVQSGASATAVLVITARDLSRWDAESQQFKVRQGAYELKVRDAEQPIKLTVT